MEHLFTPTQRLPAEIFGYTEVQLAVPIEAFLNHRWDWSDFRAFLAGDEGEMEKIIWITEDTFFWVEDENTQVGFDQVHTDGIQRATFTTTSGETHILILAKAGATATVNGAFNVFWHAVTTSNCVKLKLQNEYSWSGLWPCSGPALSKFLKASPELELLEFRSFDFKDAHCRALATLERTGLEVTFEMCSFDAQGAEATFIQWLRHSQVVTKLELCKMKDSIISALSGNSSVKKLSMGCSFDAFTGEYGDCHTRSLAGVLPGNQGIENLFVSSMLSDETWSLLLRSLWAHPRIQSLSLCFVGELTAAFKTSIMNAVFRFAQCNTVVLTIDLFPGHAKDEEFFQNSIVPRLEMNRNCFEDQRQALTRADPSIRGKLLGRALHVVRSNPDLLFRFLSENVPAFVRSDEDDPIITSGQKRKARP
jgi:hypothetical protein